MDTSADTADAASLVPHSRPEHRISTRLSPVLTTELGGKCQCKPDMRWNKEGGECQMYVDVDCSAITYETPPSKAITDAVAKAQAGGITPPPSVTDESSVLTVPTIDETISSSLLSQVDSAKAR